MYIVQHHHFTNPLPPPKGSDVINECSINTSKNMNF